MPQNLSSLFWLWIPVLAMIVQIILEVTLPDSTLLIMHSENGPHETLQFLTMLACFIVSILYFLKVRAKTALLNLWFGLALLASLYVAGEEISWGQHVWDWATPEFWTSVNDQQETNLHNTSSWLDQKPRIILLLGILFGGLILPYLKKMGFLKLPEQLDQLLPSAKLGVIAIIILIGKIVEKTFETMDIIIFARFSEVEELFMFYFVLIYLIMLYKTLAVSPVAEPRD